MTVVTNDKLVFFGTDAFSVPTLIQLLAEEWNIVAVVTKPDSPTGRGRELTAPAVKRLAIAKSIPVFQPTKLNNIHAELSRLEADAGIVVAYGKIIPVSILELFPKGLINIHASLLPKYRGASPIEATILNGDEATGVTLMKIDAGMDTGPTYEATKLQLAGTENRHDLYEHLAEIGADLISAKLAAILEGTIVTIPQDNTQSSQVSLIKKEDGLIDWGKPASQLEREIRAYLGWPSSRTTLIGIDVIITSAHVDPEEGPTGIAYKNSNNELAIYAGTGSIVVDQLKPAGKREMTGREFLAGHPLT